MDYFKSHISIESWIFTGDLVEKAYVRFTKIG